MTLIWIFVGSVVLFGLISVGVMSSGRSLQKKFVEMGTLSGRTRGEIEAIVGSPNSISATGDGGVLLQWMATGYHIALIFNKEGVCGGVSHEFANS